MTDKTDILLEKDKSWVGGILRLLFFLIAFFAIAFTVMANMGGTSDTLRQSVENFISDSLGGRPTHVERLVRMSFFPSVGFDVEGVQVRSYDEGGELLLQADKIRAYMSFWDVVMRRPEFTALSIDGLYTKKGLLGNQDFSIEKAYIDHNRDDRTAAVRASGRLGARPWDFSLGLEVLGKNGQYSYLLARERPFTLDIDGLRFDGVMMDKVEDYLRIENFKAGLSGKDIVTGAFSLSVLDRRMLKVRGTLGFGEDKGAFRSEIMIEYDKMPAKITGNVTGTDIRGDLLAEDGDFKALISRITDLFGPEASAYQGMLDLDVHLTGIGASGDEGQTGAMDFKIVQDAAGVRILSLKGAHAGQEINLEECILSDAAKNDGGLDAFLNAVLNGHVADYPCAATVSPPEIKGE